jgi:hypothetical protein
VLFSSLPAAGAALWLIGKALAGKELLFISSEDETFTTI